MRDILLRVCLASALAIVCLGAGYFVGFERGHSAAVYEEDVYDLNVYPALYRLAKHGDTNLLASDLHALVVTRSYYYDAHFSNDTVTDKHFINVLMDARAIAGQERTQADELNRANK